jgi:hypothetical protein
MDKICLAIGSWYLGDLGWVIREDLRDSLRYLSLEDRALLEILLDNKATMKLFLLDTSLWHTREFFGNLLPRALWIIAHLRFRTTCPVVRYPQRKRGYDDKGSRAQDSAWKQARAFWEDTEVQCRREKDEKTYQETLLFIQGWVT